MTKELILSQGKVTIVDDDVYEWASKFKWSAMASYRMFYAYRGVRNSSGRETTIRLHREILEAREGMQVDHINGDGLDNRRCNLRLATNTENGRNRLKQLNNKSGFKGVSWHKAAGKWVTQITVNEKRKCIYFDDPVEAALAYDKAALEHHGEFARINFPGRRD